MKRLQSSIRGNAVECQGGCWVRKPEVGEESTINASPDRHPAYDSHNQNTSAPYISRDILAESSYICMVDGCGIGSGRGKASQHTDPRSPVAAIPHIGYLLQTRLSKVCMHKQEYPRSSLTQGTQLLYPVDTKIHWSSSELLCMGSILNSEPMAVIHPLLLQTPSVNRTPKSPHHSL